MSGHNAVGEGSTDVAKRLVAPGERPGQSGEAQTNALYVLTAVLSVTENGPRSTATSRDTDLEAANLPNANLTLTELKLDVSEKSLRFPREYLRGTHRSVQGLFDSLQVLRDVARKEGNEERRGRLGEDQIDLLRAAIVFAAAGMDGTLKRLLQDALPRLVDSSPAAEKRFKQQISDWLKTEGRVPGFARDALLDREPRTKLIDLYVSRLTGSSLQSSGDIKGVRDALGIEAETIPNEVIESLGQFFHARNQIAHELDLQATRQRGDRSRRQRKMTTVRNQCDQALLVTQQLINATCAALAPQRRRVP